MSSRFIAMDGRMVCLIGVPFCGVCGDGGRGEWLSFLQSDEFDSGHTLP
jgi:hypothetical protein